MEKGSRRKVRTFTFSADPDLVAEVKRCFHEPFSQVVVDGLYEQLRLRGSGWAKLISITQQVGSLTETLEFLGRWIIGPKEPLESVRTAFIITSGSDPEASELGGDHIPEKTTWWAAALTISRSFIWFSSDSKEGIEQGCFSYFVQESDDLHLNRMLPVPKDVYERVRRDAGPLPARRIG